MDSDLEVVGRSMICDEVLKGSSKRFKGLCACGQEVGIEMRVPDDGRQWRSRGSVIRMGALLLGTLGQIP